MATIEAAGVGGCRLRVGLVLMRPTGGRVRRAACGRVLLCCWRRLQRREVEVHTL
jgi:hypothetical protein